MSVNLNKYVLKVQNPLSVGIIFLPLNTYLSTLLYNIWWFAINPKWLHLKPDFRYKITIQICLCESWIQNGYFVVEYRYLRFQIQFENTFFCLDARSFLYSNFKDSNWFEFWMKIWFLYIHIWKYISIVSCILIRWPII